ERSVRGAARMDVSRDAELHRRAESDAEIFERRDHREHFDAGAEIPCRRVGVVVERVVVILESEPKPEGAADAEGHDESDARRNSEGRLFRADVAELTIAVMQAGSDRDRISEHAVIAEARRRIDGQEARARTEAEKAAFVAVRAVGAEDRFAVETGELVHDE